MLQYMLEAQYGKKHLIVLQNIPTASATLSPGTQLLNLGTYIVLVRSYSYILARGLHPNPIGGIYGSGFFFAATSLAQLRV